MTLSAFAVALEKAAHGARRGWVGGSSVRPWFRGSRWFDQDVVFFKGEILLSKRHVMTYCFGVFNFEAQVLFQYFGRL